MQKEGKDAEAAALYRQLLRDNPRNAEAWLNLGVALRRLGHFDASLAANERAMELGMESAAYANRGKCLVDMGRIDEALAVLERGLALTPDDVLLRDNYTVALREAGLFEKQLRYLNALLAEQPDDVNRRWERALCHLYLGQFKEGWELFEIRWKLPGMAERVSSTANRWRGEDLYGRTLLIYEEQGYGDTILGSRYIPFIAAAGGKIMIECRKPLHHLLASLPGVVRVGEPGEITRDFDYHVPMMSLPGLFKTDGSNIPPPSPFRVVTLPPPEADKQLALGKDRLKVGIVWSGSVTFANNRYRAVPAERFLPFAEVPGVQLYSLQKGPCEPELAACGGEGLVLELGPHLNNFAETAAVLQQLDLVIMTDSAVAHLAGSLGVPVWNLLSYRPYWLYLSERDDTPWYPSMRLFRQPKPGDWDSVFEAARQELAALAARKPRAIPCIKAVEGRWGRCHYFEKDQYIGASLEQYGEYSPDETEFIIALAERAGRKIVLDIGANIGTMTQALEQSGFTVEAFEPEPGIFKLLTMNIKGKAHNVALGSQPGITAMPKVRYDQPYNFGGLACGTGSRMRGLIRVPVKTLDEYTFENVGLMKIDVEGYEEEVLRGARETIRRCRPVLYLEDDRAEKSASLRALLRELGYTHEAHHPSLYRAKNFFGKGENIWCSNLVSKNLVCYPG